MRQVDRFRVVLANQFERFFEHRHHPQPQQIDFDQAEIGAIFFIPLDDHAAGHGRGFQRHDGIELALADHHAAGMLAQMARQILCGDVQRKIFLDARVFRDRSRPA